MAKSVGPNCIKYVLFTFNLIFAIGGVVLAFCGVYALKKTGDLSLKLNDVNPTEYVATSMVVLGSLIFFIAFCGCCGAIRESECLLNLFSLALVFISIFQLVMALYTCFNKDDIQNSIEKSWSTLWIGRKSNQLNEDAIHAIQNYIGCCGDKGINSYSSDDNIKTRQAHDCDVRNFSNGCRSALREFVHDSSSIISYISLAMALVEFLGVIFSCCLSAHFRNVRTGFD